jgi:hypothetical protein
MKYLLVENVNFLFDEEGVSLLSLSLSGEYKLVI